MSCNRDINGEKGGLLMEKDLIIKEAGRLPATIDELQQFILVGKAKLKVYATKVKLIKDLGLAKKVKEQALEDGQDVGEAILWAEAKLGELIKSLPTRGTPVKRGGVQLQEGELKKLGMNHRQGS